MVLFNVALGAWFKTKDVAPAAAAVATNEPAETKLPLESNEPTSVPTGNAYGRAEQVTVAVEMLVYVALPKLTAVSGTKPSTRTGKEDVVAGVAEGAKMAFFESPEMVLPALLTIAKF